MTTRARDTGHQRYSETLPREPESASAARRLVRIALAVWGLDELIDDSAVVVSEMVANAVHHARSRLIRVIVSRPDEHTVRIGVVDMSKVFPQRRDPKEDDEGGRGLALVAVLAENWGSDPLPRGKHVWAELREKGDR